MEHQHHEQRVEDGAGHVVQLHQAVAHDAGAQQHREQDGRVVGQREQDQGQDAAHQRAHQAPAVALAREREARLHDDDDGQQHPVAVRGHVGRQPDADQRHGQRRGQRDADGVAEVGRVQPQVAGDHAQAQLLARDELRQRFVDAQHARGDGVRARLGVLGQLVDDARGVAQPAQHLHGQRQHLGFALAQPLLLELLDLVLDGAQLGLGAAAVLRLVAARDVQRDAVELQRHLYQGVAHEDQRVVAGQGAAQRGVIGMGGDQRIEQLQHVDEHVPQHDPVVFAKAAAARQGAQHHVARGLVLLRHGRLALDQGAVGVV
ncbi:Uncharacterised protein [Bordetella pertussis]|nr:Uncharacterised protein [Bordetella pertussis]CFE03469.1 Uncharacterised protein [Bordetella pertussis]CFL94587.1 Uncharacterised protein [Bordetella pertussis]CFM00029.1 Uncharacterised protein [Bordetella pertussis]CFM22124.1 Uncharacterised protein [Bordetella pertussis]